MSDATTTWLITGASSGIGKALAEAVLARGERVIACFRQQAQAEEFSARAPGRTFACLVDLADSAAVQPAITRAIQASGRVDVVVNSAGYGLAGALEEVSEAELRHQIETNFFGTLQVIKAALPFLRGQRRGHIFNLSSTAGVIGYQGLSLYCASKFAVEGLAESLRVELAHLGIRVTIVELDGFRTNWSSATAIVRAGTVIDDYNRSAGRIRKGLALLDGNQPGDPVKAAQAIITVADAAEPPLRLILGVGAVEGIREKLQSRLAELEQWKHVSVATQIDGLTANTASAHSGEKRG